MNFYVYVINTFIMEYNKIDKLIEHNYEILEIL